MNNPYLLASTLNLIVFVVVWLYVRNRYRLPLWIYAIVAASCVPLPVPVAAGRFVFLGDVVGVALLIVCALGRSSVKQELSGFGSAVIGLYAAGLFAWPLISTYFSVQQLSENAQLGDLTLFAVRSAAQLGFFWWAVRAGAAVASVKPLLSIPAAFWMLFAIFGILQFAGAVNVDAFWYLNGQFRSSQALTSGFMGMDKPQLALWASYVTSIAVWLVAADSSAVGLTALAIPPLSALVVFAVGSRQGAFGFALATASTALLVAATSRRRFRLMWLPVTAVVALALGPVVWSGLDPTRREVMSEQFNRLRLIGSVEDLALLRDSNSLVLVQYIVNDPHRLHFGSGVATERNWARGGGIRTYAEGEYLRVLWSGGLVSLAFYVTLLAVLFAQGVRGLLCDSKFHQGEGALLFSITLVGSFFGFGQFHLFTTTYHNVPCNYLLIMTTGLLGGAVTRSLAASRAADRSREARPLEP